LGVGRIVHCFPFQRSASVAASPLPVARVPTAMHALTDVQDTEVRPMLTTPDAPPNPATLGVGSIDRRFPFQPSASVATAPLAVVYCRPQRTRSATRPSARCSSRPGLGSAGSTSPPPTPPERPPDLAPALPALRPRNHRHETPQRASSSPRASCRCCRRRRKRSARRMNTMLIVARDQHRGEVQSRGRQPLGLEGVICGAHPPRSSALRLRIARQCGDSSARTPARGPPEPVW
jgi:hypothetical protein